MSGGVLSKAFKTAFSNVTCQEVIHPNSSCVKWWLSFLLFYAPIGAFKFYFPICFISHILQIKKWNQKKTWNDFWKLLKGSLIFGYGFISSIFISLCLEYHLFGKFIPQFVIVLPVMIGTLFTYFLPLSILKTEAFGLGNVYLEFLIRRSRFKLVEKLRNSKFFATLIFSTLNVIIMCSMLKTSCPNFWFSKFHFNASEENKADICRCVHRNLTCQNYLTQEISKSFKFGLGICIAKVLLPRIGKLMRNPLMTSRTLLRKFDYGLMAFIVGINGIFKFTFCHLNRKKAFSPLINCALASFISGIPYFLSPRYEIFTASIANAFTMIYKVIQSKFKENKKELPMLLKIDKLPVYHILMIFATSLLVQLRVFYPYHVNKVVHNFVAVGSSGLDGVIFGKIIAGLMGYEIK